MVVVEEKKWKTLWELGKAGFYGSYPENVVVKTSFFKTELQKSAIGWINHFEEKKKQLKNVKILSGIDINKALISWIKKFFTLSDYKIEAYNEAMSKKKENSGDNG